MTSFAELNMAHLSLQFNDTNKQHTYDINKLFKRGYDVITGTEAGPGSGNTVDELERVARAKDYRIALYSRYDSWVAVKESLIHKGDYREGARFGIWRSSKQPVDPNGRWGDRAVVFARWDMGPTFGPVAMGSTHFVTRRSAGPELKRDLDIEYAQSIREWLLNQSKRTAVFLAGDFNNSDLKTDVFSGQVPELITCWDEERRWENTGHGPIDAIARERRGRARCISANALNDREVFFHSDHYLLEVKYQLRAL